VERTLPQPDRETIELVGVLHALADPVRLKLVGNLAEHHSEPCACDPAANDVDLTASTLSHHWRVLRAAGITTTVAEGRRRWVSLRADDLEIRFPGLLTSVLNGAVAAPVTI
jgi:DNA-binding transcriptional ArsR family regulator